jgi:hypothetical protein
MSIDMNLVRQAIIENRIHVFKNAFPILPSWDTLLPIISDFVDDDLKVFPDRSYLSTGNLEEEYLDHRLKCRFWSRLAFHLYDPKDPYLSVIPELSPVNSWGLEGDFIFLPKNLPHEVETLKAPRASINLVLRN